MDTTTNAPNANTPTTNTSVINLIDACCEVVERTDLQPTAGFTFCNVAVSFVAKRMGYDKFSGLMANAIIDWMSRSTDWEQIPLSAAQDSANQGRLVVAGEMGDPHGHVCVIRPGIAKPAGLWQCQAPMCANVGGTNFISKGLNYAFRNAPRIWVLKQEVTQ